MTDKPAYTEFYIEVPESQYVQFMRWIRRKGVTITHLSVRDGLRKVIVKTVVAQYQYNIKRSLTTFLRVPITSLTLRVPKRTDKVPAVVASVASVAANAADVANVVVAVDVADVADVNEAVVAHETITDARDDEIKALKTRLTELEAKMEEITEPNMAAEPEGGSTHVATVMVDLLTAEQDIEDKAELDDDQHEVAEEGGSIQAAKPTGNILVDSLTAEHGGQIIAEMRTSDGFMNATKMCAAGGKRWFNYIKNEDTQKFITTLSKTLNGVLENVVISQHGGNNAGTWVHPQVAVHLAAWISPEFAVAVTSLVTRYTEGEVTTSESSAASVARRNRRWRRRSRRARCASCCAEANCPQPTLSRGWGCAAKTRSSRWSLWRGKSTW